MYHQQHQQQQQRAEWNARSQQAAWAGHHPYHVQSSGHHAQQGVAAPQVHRPHPPLPVHYPPQHHQHHHVHAGRMHHQSPYYHGGSHSPAGPLPTRQMPQQRRMRAPALVSPSAQAVIVSSPRTPQPVTSSPREAGGQSSRQGTPVPAKTTTASAAATAAASQAAANNVMTTKPPRPYTEYTMFYQLEREFILHRILTTDEEKAQNPLEATTQPSALFQNDPLMPARFRTLPLRADWYISGKSKKPTKRKHRKSHGKIGFLELTRMIAARWAKVDDETRKYCKMMAAMELVKYKEDMESYNQYKERLSAIGEIPEDMKERILKKKRAAERKEANKIGKVGVILSRPGAAKKSPSAPIIKADIISSAAPMMAPSAAPVVNAPIKVEPIAHTSPIQREGSNLDNVMEQFISSLVRSPGKPSATKTITPDRSSPSKKRRLFREKPAPAETTEIFVPLKVSGTTDDDHLDGIKMAFSGIDENEMAREFSDQVHRGVPPSGAAGVPMPPGAASTAANPINPMGPSFDYWDVLVESPGM